MLQQQGQGQAGSPDSLLHNNNAAQVHCGRVPATPGCVDGSRLQQGLPYKLPSHTPHLDPRCVRVCCSRVCAGTKPLAAAMPAQCVSCVCHLLFHTHDAALQYVFCVALQE